MRARSAPFPLAVYLGLLLASAALLGTSGCSSGPERYWQRKLKLGLAASHRTAHFDLHYRPGSDTERHLRRIAAAAEADLADICRRLEVSNDERYSLFLFDRTEDISKAAPMPNAGGFAIGRLICAVYDDDGGRFHETIHAVATTKIGPGKSAFLVEGLACALFTKPYHDMHAVAKYFRGRNALPHLAEVVDAMTWSDWVQRHSEVNIYAIAGSWMQFLLETQGVERTKRYYREGDAAAAFGLPLPLLEEDWLAALTRHAVSTAEEELVALTEGRLDLRHTRLTGDRVELGFAIEAAPLEALSFAWRKDGVALPDSTGRELFFESAVPVDTGVYTLTVTASSEGKVSWEARRSILLTVVPGRP